MCCLFRSLESRLRGGGGSWRAFFSLVLTLPPFLALQLMSLTRDRDRLFFKVPTAILELVTVSTFWRFEVRVHTRASTRTDLPPAEVSLTTPGLCLTVPTTAGDLSYCLACLSYLYRLLGLCLSLICAPLPPACFFFPLPNKRASSAS